MLVLVLVLQSYQAKIAIAYQCVFLCVSTGSLFEIFIISFGIFCCLFRLDYIKYNATHANTHTHTHLDALYIHTLGYIHVLYI